MKKKLTGAAAIEAMKFPKTQDYKLARCPKSAGYSESWFIEGPGMYSPHNAYHILGKDQEWTTAEVLMMVQSAYEAGKSKA